MTQPSLIRRVEILEEKVEALERLPARIDALTLQIVQFREDVRVEISATRTELQSEIRDRPTRREMQDLHADALECLDALRAEMRSGDEQTRREMHALHADVLARLDGLRTEMHGGDEETRRYMRVLHEEVISRIATIQEGLPPKR